jgi:hypothetical protein
MYRISIKQPCSASKLTETPHSEVRHDHGKAHGYLKFCPRDIPTSANILDCHESE